MEEARGYLLEPYKLFKLKDQGSALYEGHYHRFHKLLFVKEGHLTYFIEGQTYTIEEAAFLLVPMFMTHKVTIIGDRYYDRQMVYLSDQYVKKLARQEGFAGIDEIFKRPIFLTESHNKWLKPLIDGISEKFDVDDLAKKLMVDGMIRQITAHLFLRQKEKMTDGHVSYGDPRIVEVLRFIDNNIAEELPVATLAARTYLSPFHFMRLFKEQTGYTVHEMIIEKRLIQAERCYLSGMSLKASAICSGFSDYSTFLRAFKKRYKQSPRTYYENTF